jgi:hypothetical protein
MDAAFVTVADPLSGDEKAQDAFSCSVLIEIATMPENSPFFLDHEVNVITRTCKITCVRMKVRGLFPKRIRIGALKTVSRKYEVEEWVRDPVGWAQRNRAGRQG